MTLTERIARLCVETMPGRIGARELANARLCLIDGLAVAMAASRSSQITLLRETLEIGGASGSASLLGHRLRAKPDDAALINGMMVSLLLFDDNHSTMRGHPTGPVLPAVLALSQRLGASLETALRAFIIGYEMECRLGPVFNPSQYEVGWHATATQGTFGAAASACVLLGLDVEQTCRAFGIAASLLGGVRRNFGTMTMSFHSGIAASSGVRAAMLAQGGFTADPHIFDGDRCIGELLSREWKPAQLEAQLPLWGAPFEIFDSGPLFKLFPVGRPLVAPIEAALEIRAMPGFDARLVTEITAEVSYMYPRTVVHNAPTTGLQGKTSLHYNLAAALLFGRPKIATYSDEAVVDPSIVPLRDKVRLVVPPHLTDQVEAVRILPFDQPVTIIVTQSNGLVMRSVVQFPRGMPQNPVGEVDLMEKFSDCVAEGFDPALTSNLKSLLDTPGVSVDAVVELLAGAARAS